MKEIRTMKPSEVLDNAANIILRDGWYQGHYYAEVATCDDMEDFHRKDDEAKRSAPCCQAGAICRAALGVAWKSYNGEGPAVSAERQAQAEADSFMRRYVKEAHGVDSPIEWNDQPGRTAEEVVEALRGAAEMARSEDQ